MNKTAAGFILLLCLRAVGVTAAEAPQGWNEQAKQFIFAPSFDFKPATRAAVYHFTVESEDGRKWTFDAAAPTASLAPVWDDVPVGIMRLKVESNGQTIGTRSFYRAAPFRGPYGKPAVPYEQSARAALASVVHEPFVQTWQTTGKPDPSYGLYRYASKIIGGGVISGCALYAQQSPPPADAKEAIAIARRAANYLIEISSPAGSPLQFMPPTYHGSAPTDRENDGWTMMVTPAEAGQAYLDLWQATSDRKYFDAARRIADTYAKLQLASGTWYLKVEQQTGTPIAPATLLIPTSVMRFLARLGDQGHVNVYEPTLKAAENWVMQNPVRTFDWSAQFDDAKIRQPYQNLSKHEVCELILFHFERQPRADSDHTLDEQLLRFAEDQFVVWEQPPRFPPRNGMEQLDARHWITPCSLEQYAMFEPVSGSSAWIILSYLAAYETTHDPLDLAKAQALGNALTVAQRRAGGGRYPTRMIEQDMQYWLNSTVNCAVAMQRLALATK